MGVYLILADEEKYVYKYANDSQLSCKFTQSLRKFWLITNATRWNNKRKIDMYLRLYTSRITE